MQAFADEPSTLGPEEGPGFNFERRGELVADLRWEVWEVSGRAVRRRRRGGA